MESSPQWGKYPVEKLHMATWRHFLAQKLQNKEDKPPISEEE